ncbi:MAG: DUF1415 domain-containing protein [Porticoccaceae bacterium]
MKTTPYTDVQVQAHEAIVQHVQTWLAEVIIGFNFCPFARREFEAGRIRYRVLDSTKKKLAIKALLEEFQFLDDHGSTETTLLVFADGFREFYAYLDLVDQAQRALEDSGYEGVYQLASFHPDYLFEGEAVDDASHYTNRAPHPMIHVLRESSIARAVASDPNTDQIPERNKALARDKGAAFWQGFLSEQRSDLKP